ncbi:hypothetical protein ASD79_20100 [Caulobacter sp. Root655]|uniref:hypothetical protein n=1 Tax=Caulobacter sp. Root655 TaxID=1736578 RepID=UPI0007012AB1|nr:hypothetical protein [Caulobacter sp. Root655]KRA64748.1 hypothetical protein ASD79_20100 [Caulobacter sp. Root655]
MSYRFHVHRALPAFRLVTADGAGFPSGAAEADWRFTRTRERVDTNPDVARLVDEAGYCLFKIGMSFDEIG